MKFINQQYKRKQQNNKPINKPYVKPQKKKSLSEALFGNARKFMSAAPKKNNKKKSAPSGNGLSTCALKYALSIAEPFHPQARGICIPCPPAVPSQKVHSFNRINISLNVNGYAAAYIHPCMANDGCLVSYTSGATFLGSSSTGFAILAGTNILTTGALIASPSNLPYATSQLVSNFASGSPAVFGRIVSVGIRVHYTGTTLNESGLYSIYSSSTHENVSRTAKTPAEVGSLLDAEICSITRKVCSSSTTTCNPIETQYTNSIHYEGAVGAVYPYSSGDSLLGAPPYDYSLNAVNIGLPVIAVHMTGVAGSTFLLEVIQHIEYAGPTVAAVATNSDVDVNGFNVVNCAAAKLHGKKSVSSDTPLKMMYDCIQEVVNEVKPHAISGLLKFGASLL